MRSKKLRCKVGFKQQGAACKPHKPKNDQVFSNIAKLSSGLLIGTAVAGAGLLALTKAKQQQGSTINQLLTPLAKNSFATPQDTKPKRNNIGKLALLGGLSLAGGVLANTVYDANKVLTDPTDFHFTKDGKPDEETLKEYDTFQEGDLIVQASAFPMLGNRAVLHYGVYTGKKDGKHMAVMCYSAGIVAKDDFLFAGRQNISVVTEMDITNYPRPNSSMYKKVPDSMMYQNPNSKKLSREEIVLRAKSLVGRDYRYQGFSANCETLARAIVEDVDYSLQGQKVSPLTSFISDRVFDVVDFSKLPSTAISPADAIKALRRSKRYKYHADNYNETLTQLRKDAITTNTTIAMRSFPEYYNDVIYQCSQIKSIFIRKEAIVQAVADYIELLYTLNYQETWV